MRIIENIAEDEFLEECPVCEAHVAYTIKDIERDFGVYFIMCPICGEIIEVDKPAKRK